MAPWEIFLRADNKAQKAADREWNRRRRSLSSSGEFTADEKKWIKEGYDETHAIELSAYECGVDRAYEDFQN